MNLKRTLFLIALAAGLAGRSVWADEATNEVQALRQQLEALDQKVRLLEQKQAVGTEEATPKAAERQVQELDQKVRVIERREELKAEEAEAKAKESPRFSVGASGLSVSSADTNFVMALRGLVQVDSRTFFNDGGISGNDAFLLRRARPIFQGTVFKSFDFLFVPDFGGSSTVIQDAWLNYRYKPWLQLRAGKYKVPVGLELLQSDAASSFNERALPTGLTPNRDIGFQLWGDVAGGKVSYAAGVFNGVGDGRNTSNTDFEDHREAAARLFIQPFKGTKTAALQGFGVGVGASYGNVSSNSTGLSSGYLTDGQQAFFVYTNGVVADGNHWRVSPQGYYYLGPFGFMGEYVISDQEVRRGALEADLRHTGWQVAGGWVLTGEDASYSGVVPKRPFSPGNGQWGAFQIVGRYAELDIDNDAFPLFANPDASASAAQAWAVGLNWYLSRNVRLSTSFSRTTFTGGGNAAAAPGPVTSQPEEVFFTRLQLAF